MELNSSGCFSLCTLGTVRLTTNSLNVNLEQELVLS